MKLKGKFIGGNKIVGHKKSKEVTFLGKPKIVVKYASGKSETFPEEMLNYIVTDKQEDASSLRERAVVPVVEKILTILVESELSLDDIGYAVGPKLTFSLQDSVERALKTFFDKDIRVNGVSGKVTLKDIDKILQQNGK